MSLTRFTTVLFVTFLNIVLFGMGVRGSEPNCKFCNGTELPKGDVCFSNFANSSVKPWCPTGMDVKFYLYTGQNVNEAQMIQAYDDSLKHSNYNPHLPVKILIHGYGGSSSHPMNERIKNSLLEKSDMNIIVVDWAIGAAPEYIQACANTMSVGVMIGQLITTMYCFHGDFYQRVHCIGYSLGAHVCGFAGKEVHRLKTSLIGRITGLDTAGPEFEDNQESYRLDKTDARFVDAIHTDAVPGGGGWGILKAIGHVDFYVNGGYNQPRCRGFCSHRRSYWYYIYSIDEWNYDHTAERNRCIMGYHVDNSCRGDHYPQTQSSFPYRPLNITD